MRRHWLGAAPGRGEFARRLCASADVFEQRGREPAESINFVVAHDGFTLRDLLTYEHRRNEANGEHNRDGHAANHGWNCGVEGPSDDPAVLALRARLERALLATLLLAQGTPMLAAGAELGHSQGGNNNAYCQDNPTNWIDWARADEALIAFTARLGAARRRLVGLHRRWYRGSADAAGVTDLAWRRPDGEEVAGADWHDAHALAIGALFGGRWLLLANAEGADVVFALPPGHWRALVDSARDAPAAAAAGRYTIGARSIALLESDDAP